jgi:zinc protease
LNNTRLPLASLEASAGNERMSFHLRTLTDPALLAQSVALAARQLAAPSFPAQVWQSERERLAAAIRESRTRPGTVASIAFEHAVYGAHPYGVETTPETLAAIAVQDMRRFYAEHVQPCRAKVSLVGAVTREQADALALQLLAGLPAPAACAPLPAVPPVQPLSKGQQIDIPFESAQAHVLMGQPGSKRTDPDHFALYVGNYILGGGGFVSRLTNEVREQRGLSYSVYSSFAPGLDAGAFVISLQTRPEQAAQALAVARQVLADFVAGGPTEAEVKAAQDNLVNGFALLLDSNAKLLGNVANIAWNGLPLDYLDTWVAKVQGISAADIKAAFARKIDPARLVTVVVGGAGR